MTSPLSPSSPHNEFYHPPIRGTKRKELFKPSQDQVGAEAVETPACEFSTPERPHRRHITPQTTPYRPEHVNITEVFKAHVSPGGTVSFPMPAMGAGAFVYGIFDRQTDQAYIGSTTQDPRDRFRQHASCINHPDKYHAPAYQHFSKRPQDIRFGVIEHHSQPMQDLAERECQYIASLPSPCRLNANKGGTGGVSFAAAQSAAVAKYGEPSGLPPFETTPEKSYPFARTLQGRVVCQLTPGAKEKEGIVYSIEGPHGSYTGFSTRSTAERVCEHARTASRAATDPKLANHPLYSPLSSEPESYVLKIHASSLQHPSHLTEIEAQMIKHKEEKGSAILNQNKGRGGCFKRA